MNWSEIIEEVAERTGMPQSRTKLVLDTLIEVLVERVAEGDKVVLWGLGTLYSRWNESRTLRSISDGRRIRIDGRWAPQFRPSTRLRTLLAQRSPQHWRDPDHQNAWKVAETLVGDLALYHPDQAPALEEDVEFTTVIDACEESFGPLWQRVRLTYESQVPRNVRLTADYLGMAARARWAAPPA